MPTFSHSSLSTFESCPLHYSFRYVQKITPPDDRETIELFAGKRVHETLAELHLSIMKGKEVELSNLSEYYKTIWQKNFHNGVYSVKDSPEFSIDSYFNSGIKWIADYYHSNKPFDNETSLKIEWKINIPLGVHNQYKLVGVIDRLSKLPDGTLLINDYKTSRNLPTDYQIDLDRQLSLYQLGVQKEFDSSSNVKLVWHYLAFNKKITIIRPKSKLDEIERSTIKLALAVQDATEQNSFPAKKGPLCNYCEYKPICPEWKVADNSKKQYKRTIQTKLNF